MQTIINTCLYILVSTVLYSCAPARYFYSSGAFGRTPTSKKHVKRAYNKPYTIKNIKYYPRKYYEYSEIGMASYYGGRDHGNPTSTGEIFSKHGLTAAHKTLPLPSIARVTNLKNGKSVIVRINDRGPFAKKRIVDVSEYVAKLLGFHHDGEAKVHVECLVSESMLLATRYKTRGCSPRNVHCHNFYNRVFHSVFPKFNRYRSPYLNQAQSPILNAQLRQRPGAHKKKYIQVGTSLTYNRAQILKNKIYSKLTLPSKIHYYTKNGKKHYKILIGPVKPGYDKRMITALRGLNLTNIFIVNK